MLKLVNKSATPLEPIDRVSEVLFGLIMVLTFTGSLSVADAGRDDVRAMLVGALGCNLAWGIIDALFYLMACLAGTAEDGKLFHAIRTTNDAAEGQRLVGSALPAMITSVMTASELQSIRRRLIALPESPRRARLGKQEWLGALSVCAWVFVSTFPVALPFLFIPNVAPAMRVSNAIALALLFLSGYLFGRMSGYRPWLVGIAMVAVGTLVVGMTIALGG